MKLYRSACVTWWLAWLAFILTGGAETQAAAKLFITEFQADNESTLKDDFGEFPDWIELYNAGDETVNLAGYSLTDSPGQLTQWRFPSTNLPPRRFLLVFASGRNRTLPGASLHTNFKLDAAGEYLALVDPDGTSILTEFAFGAQNPGVSFGLALEVTNEVSLLPVANTCRVLIPTSNSGATWIQPGFDDTTWTPSFTSIGFETNGTANSLKPFFKTDVFGPMFLAGRPSAYLRIPFLVENPGAVADVQFRLRYDDGFAAFLNGRELGRRNAATNSIWNSTATAAHANALAVVPEEIAVSSLTSLLVQGTNILAIQGLNRAGNDPDFLIGPELLARDVLVRSDITRFFSVPTPGRANSAGLPAIAGPVDFSRESGIFTNGFSLALSMTSAIPGAVIRYTVDRSVPTESSPAYTSPILVTNTVQIRARSFEPGNYPGPVHTENFVQLQSSLLGFSSDLPVIILHTMGGGTITDAGEKPGYLEIHDTFRGRSSLSSEPQIRTRAGAKVRGSSTGAQAKKALTVEFWDEANGPRDLSPLGMPADSDWILYPPNNAEPVLIHNPYAYELYRQFGRYSVRTRFVEVYLNEQGGALTTANYFGIYVLTEKIKIGPDRVDIEPLQPSDRTPPDVTGGYLFKIDRRDPGDTGFNGAGADLGGIGPCYVDPKESEIRSLDRDPQEQYVNSFFTTFGAALNGANYTNPTNGYAKYLDVDVAIDFHLLSALTFSVDANVLSTFFYKPRDGKLTFGPPWDFDRSMGSLDPGFERDKSPRVWAVQTYLFHMPWWERMFSDSNFYQRWIDRYQQLRRGLFSVEHLHELVDVFVAQVREAQVREVARWPGFTTPRSGTVSGDGGYFFSFGNSGYQGEVDQMKHWLRERVAFMDGNFVEAPTLSATGGRIAPGFSVTLSGPPGATVYYTLDGTDPRLPGGNVNPRALVATGPIVLNQTARVFARARNTAWRAPTGGFNPVLSSPWSGYAAETFYVELPALVVTELMYHPASAPTNSPYTTEDFEFVEVKNVGAVPLALGGVSFTNGISFTFPESTLAPSATMIVVRNRAAFESRYGGRGNIAGEFKGTLDNQGERLALVGALREPLLDFTYRDDWYPLTDGYGFSLVIREEGADPVTWGSAESWRASAQVQGSPGVADPKPPGIPSIVINEILTLAPASGGDAVELYNPTSNAVDVGGWFLTDNADLPDKYRVANGLKVPGNGYLVLRPGDLLAQPGATNTFGLDRLGEQIFLFSTLPNGDLSGYITGFEFPAAAEGVSFGRHEVNPSVVPGVFEYPAQRSPSLGGPNTGPQVGPVVINEIHYHPPDILANSAYWDAPEFEFVELKNVSGAPVALFDPEQPTRTWRLRTAVDYDFPTNLTLSVDESVLIVNFDPALERVLAEQFRRDFALASPVRMFGPLRGKLDNSTERVVLQKPGLREFSDSPLTPYTMVDQVRYQDSAPWPLTADGYGPSLQRLDPRSYGNDPGNWVAAAPTPGSSNHGRGGNPVISQQPQSTMVVLGQSARFSVTASGSGKLFYQWRRDAQVLNGETNATLQLDDVALTDQGDYSVVVYEDGGFTVSGTARLNLSIPARILIPPSSVTANPGTNVTFRVTAAGQGPLRYQWMWNGQPITDATNSVLTLSNVGLPDQGDYRVTVTDAVGSITSPSASLTVLLKPVITLQLQPVTAVPGETVTLSFAAYGTPPIWYRWRRDVTYLSGYLTNHTPFLYTTLTFTNVQAAQQAIYQIQYGSVALSSGFSSAVRLAVVTDADADGIEDDWETAGGLNPRNPNDADLDLDADGQNSLQEYRAGTDPNSRESRFELLINSSTEGRSVLSFQASSNRTYSIQYRESLNQGAWLTLTNIPSRLNSRQEAFMDPYPRTATRWYRVVAPQQPREAAGPLILSSPGPQSVLGGAAARFEVVAAGFGALRYQWLRNSLPLPGATSAVLVLPAVRTEEAGIYSVRVTDFLGTVLSFGAELEVQEHP